MKQFFPLALGLVAATIAAPAHADTADQAAMPVGTEVQPTAASSPDSVALNFEPPRSSPSQKSTVNAAPTQSEVAPASQPESGAVATGTDAKDWYKGGSESVVARVVGAAEGTRNPDGSKTDIYDGHVDPGNGVWNRGTFSYQFGNEENLSAEEADRRQMAKIKRIHESVVLAKAQQHGVAPMTVAEELNGVDMINQAPLAVTEAGGYVERLAEAKQKKGLSGEQAILEARVWSFWDAAKGGWDAPGLRAYDDMGKEASIRHDQQRRMGMIDQALADYQQQHGTVAQRSQPGVEKMAFSPRSSGASDHAEQAADLIIFGAPGQENQVANK